MSEEIQIIVKKIASKSDLKAFGDFFNYYNDRLLKIAQYFLKRKVIAEEIVADVFVKIWKDRKDLGNIHKLDHFLFTMVKRKCIDHLRKDKTDNLVSINDYELTVKTDTQPEKEMLYREFEAVVNFSISILPPKTQLIFKMVKEDGLKYSEVAEILEVSEKTVEYHMGQALKSIRQDIHKYKKSNNNQNNQLDKLAMIVISLLFSFFI